MDESIQGGPDPLGLPGRMVSVPVRRCENNGVTDWWEPDARVSVEVADFAHERFVVIAADRAGLVTLARSLLTLAQSEVPDGLEIRYDAEHLDGASVALSLVKTAPR